MTLRSLALAHPRVRGTPLEGALRSEQPLWAAVEPLVAAGHTGVHFTPPELAARVVGATLDPLDDPSRIVDPACGAGVFLVAALRWLRARFPDRPSRELVRRVFGVELHPLAVDAARLALWLEVGDPDLPLQALDDQIIQGDAVSQQDFPLAGTFDAVVGNPPFGNAIEKATRRSRAFKEHARATFPPFAAGAYDGSLLFVARTALHLLHERGRYGLLVPTALLSSLAPWQAWMHARWRPDLLRLLPVDRFAGARIRTTALVGGAGQAPEVEVVDEERGRTLSRPWPVVRTWYEATRPALVQVSGAVPLGEVAQVRAGCATGVAYQLREHLTEEGRGPRLVTTGALDPYRCHWGQRPQRFLGSRYLRPRWPEGEELPPALVRARDAQAGSKILVGGLTEVLEAWLDAEGTHAGVVSTWVITLRPGQDPDRLWEILAALGSATLTRILRQRFGGLAMSGRQLTIKKAALLELPIPRTRDPELAVWARARQAGGAEPAWGHHRMAELLGREPHEDWRWGVGHGYDQKWEGP